MATSRDVLNSIEVHPHPNFDIFQLAETMISLATVTGIPVAYVDGQVVANSRTSLENLVKALRGPKPKRKPRQRELPFLNPNGDDDEDDD